MKRLGDFLNVESFDLALLEEVGCMELIWNLGRRGGWGAGGDFSFGERVRQAASPLFPGVE